jgi:copper(I)-binding protein
LDEVFTMRSLTAALAIALAPALALSACDKPQPDKVEASSTPDAKPGISVTDGRLILPAVKGNPAAAYFTLANTSSGKATLAAVAVDGADSAEMHQTQGDQMIKVDRIEADPGTSLEFKPGGLHVMVFGLKSPPAPGAKIEMTLTFADGDKLSAPLTVAAAGAGDDMGHMGGMH